MIANVFSGEACRSCGRDLGRSYLTRLTPGGIEKAGAMFYPLLCLCGSITVIGAGAFISHIEDFLDPGPDSEHAVALRPHPDRLSSQ